jgi:hypothetical protein
MSWHQAALFQPQNLPSILQLSMLAFTLRSLTDAMDVDTPKDSFTPEGLEWYRIKTNLDEEINFNKIGKTQPLQMVMLCAVCDNF